MTVCLVEGFDKTLSNILPIASPLLEKLFWKVRFLHFREWESQTHHLACNALYWWAHTLPREVGWPIHANSSPFTAFSLLSLFKLLKKHKIISYNIFTVEPTQLPIPVFGNHLSRGATPSFFVSILFPIINSWSHLSTSNLGLYPWPFFNARLEFAWCEIPISMIRKGGSFSKWMSTKLRVPVQHYRSGGKNCNYINLYICIYIHGQ